MIESEENKWKWMKESEVKMKEGDIKVSKTKW